jgi:hypothetical protein
MRLTHIRDLTVEAPLASGHAFLSAASGLVVSGNRLCVVADDAHCLALFTLGDAAPGKLVRLIEGDLPSDAAERKRVKPDFEVLVALNGFGRGAGGDQLLAMGSGSTPRRMRGAVVDLPASGEAPILRAIDLTPLFAALAPLVPEINLEGALVAGERLLLFNRGNTRFPASHILEVPLGAVLGGGPVTASFARELALPMVSGVPLTVTDACRLDNGHILLSAVAEATADSYADGALLGAAIVELNAAFGVVAVEPLDPPVKVEGIAVRETGDGLHLLCVTDADDPERASGLYGACYTPASAAGVELTGLEHYTKVIHQIEVLKKCFVSHLSIR